nr:solute carrier organic anion transporter family member 74D-like [Procambarus clarkii]
MTQKVWDESSGQYCDVQLLAALAADPTVSYDVFSRSANASFLVFHPRPAAYTHTCLHTDTLVVLVWVLASILNGVGSGLVFTVGIPYLDDAISKHDAPLYLAVIVATGVFGPLLGLSLSDLTLGLYVYPTLHPGVMTSDDPRWVGAWWLGQLGFSVVMLAMASLLLLFPRSLRKGARKQEERPRRTSHTLEEDLAIEELVRTSVVPRIPTPHHTPQHQHSPLHHTPQHHHSPLHHTPQHHHSPPPPPTDTPGLAEVTEDDYSVEEQETEGGYPLDERDSGYSMEVEGGYPAEDRDSQHTLEAGDAPHQGKALHKKRSHITSREIKSGIKELWATVARLMKNKVVVYTLCSDFFLVLGTSVVSVWLPKYIQQQFRVTKTNSSFYTGVCGTWSAMVGVGVGGVWVRRCRPRARTVALVMAACLATHTAALLSLMFISCHVDADLPGIMAPDFRSVELHRGCSEGCRCAATEVSPVCVRDGPITLSYYSPCHAGCPPPPPAAAHSTQDPLSNCTCGSPEARITRGYCQDTCSIYVVYNVVTCITESLLSVTIIGSLLIALRCVEVRDKSAALGIKSTIMSLAALVSPVVAGTLVDSACLVWKEECGTPTSCSLYNTIDFGHRFHGLASVVFTLSTIFTLLVSRHVRDLELLEDTAHSLPSFSFFDTGAGSSPSIRRSFRKMSRLATGRTSSGKWKVPTMTSQSEGGEMDVMQREHVKNEEDTSDGDTQPTVYFVKPNILPSLVIKTTNV